MQPACPSPCATRRLARRAHPRRGSARRAVALLLLTIAAPAPAAAQCEGPSLLPDPAVPRGGFGAALAHDGQRLAVGARAGGVRTYRRDGQGWQAEALLTPPAGAAPDDGFGGAVALSGEWLVVGAPGHDAPWGDDVGRAHVYRLRPAGWQLVQQLTPRDALRGEGFGTALACDGARLLVGAPGDDDQGQDRGSVSLFELDGGRWVRTGLFSEDGATAARFGSALALDGDRALIGADDPLNTGAWVFEADDEGLWGQTVRVDGADLLGGASGSGFGRSLDLVGGRLVVGAPGHVHDGAPAPHGGNVGAVYVFEFDPIETLWVQTAELLGGAPTPQGVFTPGTADPHAPAPQLGFGAALDLSADGRDLAIGAPDGQPGSAHLLELGPVGWQPTARLFGEPRPPLPEPGARFGWALALRGDELVVAAPADGEVAPGAGRLQVWRGPWSRPGWSGLGGGLGGRAGVPCLEAEGAPLPGAPVTLRVHGARPDAPGWLVLGAAPLEQLAAGGLLVPQPMALTPLQLDPTGATELTLRWPVVDALWLQAWVVDASGPAGWTASHALLGGAGVDLAP